MKIASRLLMVAFWSTCFK